MKKIINEKYVNPLRSRFVLEYNAMTEEQQHQSHKSCSSWLCATATFAPILRGAQNRFMV